MKKILLLLLLIYTLFFIVCGVIAPVFAVTNHYYSADVIYLLMHRSCPQEALRCFWIFGYQMAICARCFGAYCGVTATIILWLLNIKFSKKIYLLLILIAFGEILLENLDIYDGNNYIRYFAGVALGGFVAISLYYIVGIFGKGKNNV